MAEIKLVHVPGQKPIRILKWLVKKGDRIKHGTPLALYRIVEDPSKQSKAKEIHLKSKHVGTIKMFLMQEGQVAIPEGVLLEIEGCGHPVVMKDLCAECGQDLRPLQEANSKRIKNKTHSATVSMIPSIPELKISTEQAEQIAQQDKNRLHQMKKLVLLVDLDQTLIHTTQDPGLAALCHSNDDFYSFQLSKNDPMLFTKLRPHCREFLKEVSQRYELQIVTFGSRQYAHKIADFIDKEKKHFAHRILSRDECIHPFKKSGNLRHLFPCGDSMVCIIDDRDDVWNSVPNLIMVKKYNYFQGTGDINNPYNKEKTKTSAPQTQQTVTEITAQLLRKRKSGEDAGDGNCGSEAKRSKDEEVTDNEPAQNEAPSEYTPQLDSNENKIKLGEEQEKIDDDLNISSDSESSSGSSSDSGSSDNENIVSDDESTRQSEPSQETIEECKEVSKNTTESIEENATENKRAENVETVKTPQRNGLSESIESNASDEIEKSSGVKKLNGENSTLDTEANTSSTESVPASSQEASSQESETRDKNSQEIFDREQSGFSGPSQEFTTELLSQDSAVDNQKNFKDSDDYLCYLKDVLLQIHDTYYDAYGKFLSKEFEFLPDVRDIVPFLRSKVLYGCHIVFTGIIPTTFHLPPHMHRAHVIARQLGAKVEEQVSDQTTHLITAKKGTTKFQEAIKRKKQKIKLVAVEWLWCCSERWDKVEEKLFPVPDKYIEASKPLPTTPEVTKTSEPERIADPRPVDIPPANTYDPVTGKLIKKVQDPRFSFMVAESQQRRLDKRHHIPLYSSLQIPNTVIPVAPEKPNSQKQRQKLHPLSWKHNPLSKSNTAPEFSPGRRSRKRSMAETVGLGYSLSTDDIADMDKEVDDLLESDEEDDDTKKESTEIKKEKPIPMEEDVQPTTSKGPNTTRKRTRQEEELGTMIEEVLGDSPAPFLEKVKEGGSSDEEEGEEESSEDDEMEALLNAEMHYDDGEEGDDD